ncbi:MAG: transglycosylase SLT domain-containing protein [Mesorhizobium sp.]
MPARASLTLIGMALCGAALGGCTSTSTVAPAPGFAGPTVGVTETTVSGTTDAGFALALPETVAVLPEPSALAPVQTAALETQPAAFAGATPATAPAPAQVAAAETAQPAIATTAAKQDAAQPDAARFAGDAAKPDLTKTFPAAPVLVASAASSLPVTPIAYSGTVPAYLAPAVLKTEPSAGDLPRTAVRGRADGETLISKYAALYEVPVELVRHVVNRESTFNPKAYNNGHWGLMQIKHATARGMGYSGSASGLFDAETNLKYAVKYLRGAWLVSGRNAKRADWLYQTGYYYEAKRKGMLEETGLGKDRKRRRAGAEVTLDPEGIVHPPVVPVGSES